MSVSTSLFRVDSFAVPAASLSAFLARVHNVDRLLARQPSCRQNLVLTQTEGPGEFNVVTIVEWASAEAMARAKATMRAHYASEGFDPPAFMKSLGVRGNLAVYSRALG
ncbi:antibiotic biosynthesis monooxygenase [Ideonella sp. YS5]|uniref:antibiotic biosynthesis monooxygenase n=1 Tax=Ideonella sp. YS5 TaxID=3453714 RepID=UPI003EEED2D0